MSSKRRIVLGVTVPLSLVLFRGFPEQLVAQGWDVHVVSSPGERLNDLATVPGVTAHSIGMTREPHPIRDLVALFRWWSLLRKLRPQIVCVGTPKAGMLAMFAAKLAGVRKRIYHMRGLRLETATGLARVFYSVMERAVFSASTSAIVVSKSLRARALELGLARPGKLRVLGYGSSNGVDVTRYHPVPHQQRNVADRPAGLADDAHIIGFVGRLHRDKGIDELISASVMLTERGVDHQLLIVGGSDGNDADEFVARLSSLQRPAVLVGAVPDTSLYYQWMDLFCLPTHREGMPNVALEAAASGVPVVTTDATGAVDSVIDGRTGRCVQARNPRALAAALEEALSDDDWRDQAGALAREFAMSRFSRSVVHRLLTDYFEELAADGEALGEAEKSNLEA